ncbi:hypothetical protein [Natronocalculus amylovorans]|uniref:Uncharacterized protein n=1 Tax=Natronocalculus amylovorans TaxID=2917812 RepID=A0AAE3KAR3_9EURY|nr:hypothetical protein [Natronocalculus amylovorans]MCL9817004.1 hypothetical protein [Natronocalculus amylovorans]NUE02947.1 hypothetical protein [Halorubraceae archaeon YAN]
MFREEPVLHPDDQPEPDEAGPWIQIIVISTIGWILLFSLDWLFLVEGTFVWATVRIGYTFFCAPLAAAGVLQDTRALAVRNITVGPIKWIYAIVILLAPPVVIGYALHRWWLTKNHSCNSD